MPGSFVISLDFELLWGVQDQPTSDSYRPNILGARRAIPQILDLFAARQIRATWATVGFLFAESRDELLASVPPEHLRPKYEEANLSGYHHFYDVGADEASDPYHFGYSLIQQIVQTPGQELGAHTLSHYYCLEPGSDHASFRNDLEASQQLATKAGITLKSIVFPRNQYNPEHLEICRELGYTAYRGNANGWAYAPASEGRQFAVRRIMRLIDAYTGALGAGAHEVAPGEMRNVAASHFLRPKAGRLAPLHDLQLARIKRGMTCAAASGKMFHLWWHPHNFGLHTQENLSGLSKILDHFAMLQDRCGMASRAMGDF